MVWKIYAEHLFYVALTVTFSQLGGSVIKYSENSTRKQWLKETPETLMNILKNADLSLAFQTYTIYRPGDSSLLRNCGNTLIFFF